MTCCFLPRGLEYRGGAENTKLLWCDIYYYRLLYYADGSHCLLLTLEYYWATNEVTLIVQNQMFQHVPLQKLFSVPQSDRLCGGTSAWHLNALLGNDKVYQRTHLTNAVNKKNEISAQVKLICCKQTAGARVKSPAGGFHHFVLLDSLQVLAGPQLLNVTCQSG